MNTPDPRQQLAALLEKEIGFFRALLREMTAAAEVLRRGAPDALLKCIHALGARTEALENLHEEIRLTVARILPFPRAGGWEENWSDLMAVLAAPQRQQMRSCRSTVAELKERVRRLNGQQKVYLEALLACLRDVFALLTSPLPDPRGYRPAGRGKPPAARFCSFSEEV